MFKIVKMVSAAIVFSTLAITGTAQAAIVTDGGFEIQGAALGNTCSMIPGGGRQCAAGAWSASGSQAGINLNDGQNFAGSTPDGSYYAFLQSLNGSTSSIFQNVTVTAGKYMVSWLAGGRTNYSGPVNYTVSLGSQIYSGGLAQAQPFTATSALVTLAAGTYALNFSAHANSGDNSALIDKVSIAAVPEPAMWGLMIGGFGLTGAAMRRGRKATASFA